MNGADHNENGLRRPAEGHAHGRTWAFVLFGLIAGACQTTHQADNSNTSWLACDRDRDCERAGSGFECQEHRCVRAQPPDGGTAGRGMAGGDSGAAGTTARRDASAPAPDAGGGGKPGSMTDAGDLCPDGEIVESERDCLLDSAFCRALPDGRYCTGSVTPTCPFPWVPIGVDEPCPDGAICHAPSEVQPRCQELPLIDPATCYERGGGMHFAADPNHLPLFAAGCPFEQAELGRFDATVVSTPPVHGLCCALTIEACAPQAPHFTGDCEGESRYYWTGTVCVAKSGCECTGPYCDDGTLSAEICESQFGGCAAITKPCGGFAGETCTEDEYCAYTQECGTVDGSAICMPRPESCPDYEDPVCGCDGQTYANLCFANAAGTGMLRFGACN